MRRFVRKTALFLAFCLLLSVVPSVIADPFNVFHWRAIRNITSEPNKNYIKTRYILANPEKYEALLFGSSRVGAIHTERFPEPVYNMTYSEGLPAEHLDNLETFLEAGIRPKTIYMGVDSRSYTVDPGPHQQEPLRASYRYLKQHPMTFARMYFDSTQIRQFVENNLNRPGMGGYSAFYTYGWALDYGVHTGFDGGDGAYSIGTEYRMEETLGEIRRIADLCRENDIRFVLFTNPMFAPTYTESVARNYGQFLKGLAEITDYYNFSGLNDITRNPENYVDKSHYNAEVGDRIVNVLTGGRKYDDLYDQGFGWYVTKENVDELIQVIG